MAKRGDRSSTLPAEFGPDRPSSPDGGLDGGGLAGGGLAGGSLADGLAGGSLATFELDATAQYIAEMTSALAAMAREGRLDFLAHLLDIAQLEAASVERRLSSSRRSR